MIGWIEGADALWIYGLVFISTFFESVLTPLPGDTAVVFGAYLGGLGQLSFLMIYLSATLGGTLGFLAQYLFGLYIYTRGMQRGRILKMNMRAVEKVGVYFRRWGYWVILFNRFLYGIRFFVGIFAGLSKMPWYLVIFLAFLSAALWNLILVYLGLTLGENWEFFREVIWKYNRFFLAAVLLVIVVYLFWRYYLKRIIREKQRRDNL